MNMKVSVILVVTGTLGIILKRFLKELVDLESGDHRDYSIIKIGQNSQKSPGDLRRLAVTQTPVKNHQSTGAKTPKEGK